MSYFLPSYSFFLLSSEVKHGSYCLFLDRAGLPFSFRLPSVCNFLLIDNDPLVLSCAHSPGDEATAVGGVWQKTFLNFNQGMCSKSYSKVQELCVGYRLMRVAVIYAGEWCYILAESRNVSVCHVLCVMLERVLRTCPDGSVFPFFLQATDGANGALLWKVTVKICNHKCNG